MLCLQRKWHLFRNDREAAVAALSSLFDEVSDIQDRMPPEVNRIMKLAQSTC